MADTTFSNGTVVEADWLNDVNDTVYPGTPAPGTVRHEVFGRTAAEIAAGVTPTNYAYPPRHSRRYGAVGDGSDETAEIQQLIDVCEAEGWAPAIVQDRIRLGSSVIIDRPVDTHTDEFRIVGLGKQAGFYTTGNVTMFDSSLAVTTDPLSEFVTFERIRFESSSFFNTSYVLSKKFLRIKFVNCFFWLIRCQLSTIYAQTLHFLGCNIRNSPSGFVNCAGSYDISFSHCIIENNFNLFRSVDAARGATGIRIIDCALEGQQESTVIATGASGFTISGNHIEGNQTADFNFFAGVMTNKSIVVSGNYIYNPVGASFYYGPCEVVVSSGNTCFPNTLHSNVAQVVNFTSTGDSCSGGVTDSPITRTLNGITRAGNAQDIWSDSANQITKDSSGNFGLSTAALASTRLLVMGKDQTSTAYAAQCLDSGGNVIVAARNDRVVLIPALQNAVNDAAAAGLGVPVGGLYRNGSIVMVRVV